MKSFDWLLLVSRWLHLLSAIVAIGGAAFALFALLPAAKSVLDDATHERLREAVRGRWAKIVHTCIALLLITGSLNFVLLAMPPKIDPLPYHPLFGVKFLAALGIFYIAIGLASRSPVFAKLRAARAKWLKILLILAVAVVLVSGALSQVRGWPKKSPPPASAVG